MLNDLYPPVIGGLEQYVRRLAVELVERGHAVSVLTLDPQRPGAPPFEFDRGVRVHRVLSTVQRASWLFSDQGRPFAPPLPDPELVRALRAVIARERPQLVHAHSWLVRSFLPLKRWSGARLVMSLHDYSLQCSKKSLLYGDAVCSGPGLAKCLGCASRHYGAAKGVPVALSHLGMRFADAAAVDMFLPVSRAVAAGNGLAGTALPYRVLPNFIPDDSPDLPAAARATVPAGLPDGEFVLYAGALQRHKGIEVLLRAYAGLRDVPPLVLIGASWGEAPLEVPPNVVVLKNWSPEAVQVAWRRSLFGVVPSIWADPCPTVALEAMAAGRAVAGSRLGGLVDIVADGETGLLVPPGDADALRGALRRLVDDAALRLRLGRAGRERGGGFRASAVVPQIEQVYRRLTAA
jgi:glycosyltransferase involved in cell wall biosynthesis